MARLYNRAKMTISSTGTGNITLASAVSGYQSFLDSGASDGDVIRYIIEDNSGADWEIGTASVSNNSTVLVRTVEESSATNNAALNLTSSAKVFIGVTAKDLDNAAPIFTTTPASSLILKNDGSTAVTLTAKAYDEGGIPISYDWDAWLANGTTIYDASSLPPQFASAPSINQSTGVYSLVGSSNSNNAGTLNFRAKASDGVKVATHITECGLSFFPGGTPWGYWNIADSDSYSGSGNTWTDLSGNGRNLTIENGAYSSTGYSSTPAWVWTGTDLRIDLPNDLSAVKTYIFIWGYTGSNSKQYLISSSTEYVGRYHATSSGAIGSATTHTGETQTFTVNGNVVTQGGQAKQALEVNKLNIVVARGYQMTETDTVFGAYNRSVSYNHPLQLRAIIMYDQMLTDAEVKEVYDLFPSASMATWDGS